MRSLLLVPFLVNMFICGIGIAFFALKERRPFAFLPLGGLLGLFGFTVLLNAAGHLMPLRTALIVVTGLFAAGSAWSLVRWFRHPSHRAFMPSPFSPRQRTVLLCVVLAVSLLSGLMALRSRHSDDLSLTHASLAATMVEGNFPPRDPSAPDRLVEYHYVPELLAAAFRLVGNLPIWAGYDLQIFLLSGGLIAIAFLCAYTISNRFRDAILAAVLLFYGGGFSWLSFPSGIDPVWRAFVRHEPVEAPWAFLSGVVNAAMASPPVVTFHDHTPAVGLTLLFLLLYLLWTCVLHDGRMRWPLVLLTGMLFGHLALAQETVFVVLGAALGVLLLVFVVRAVRHPYGRHVEEHRPYGRRILALVIIFAIAAFSALTLGGLLQQKVLRHDTLGAEQAFVLTRNPFVLDFIPTAIPLFSFAFVAQFGLPFVLFLPAAWAFRKDARMRLVALTALFAFSLPLLIRYQPGPNELVRVIQIAQALASFLVACWLARCLAERASSQGRTSRLVRSVAALALAVIPIQGFVIQAAYVAMPLGKLGQAHLPYVAAPPTPHPSDAAAYAWIRSHTAPTDRFYPFNNELIRETGRPTPGFFVRGWGDPVVWALADKIRMSCDAGAIRTLRISYFYVTPTFPIPEWESVCATHIKIEPLFTVGEGEDRRALYRVEAQHGS